VNLGEKIRDLRKERGLTLTDVAGKLEISPSYLSAVERGLRKPSIPLLKRISDVLNISVAYLVGMMNDGITSERLRFMRESRNLGLEDMAEISEIPLSTLEKFESGLAKPDPDELKRMSEALNIPMHYFLDQGGNNNALGYKLKRLRVSQGMTTTALAEKAGVSPGLISQVENGQTTPLLDTLGSISEALNTSVSYFLMEQEDVQDLLATLNADVMELLADPKVQAVLRAVRECDTNELKYIINYIHFFKRNRDLL